MCVFQEDKQVSLVVLLALDKRTWIRVALTHQTESPATMRDNAR